MGFRDIKRRAREALHEKAKVPAIYFPAASFDTVDSNSDGVGVDLYVRVHTKYTDVGIEGVQGEATMDQDIPTLVFWYAELEEKSVSLRRNDVISVEAGEAYFIQNIRPRDGQTITAEVSRLPPDETSGLPVPDSNFDA